MFSPQKINVTDLVHPGRNVIAIQVWKQWKDELSSEVTATVDDNYAAAWNIIAEAKEGKIKDLGTSQKAEKLMHKHIPHGFYNNSPAGIWRDVTLVITEKVKLEEFYFKPALAGAEIDVTYANYSDQAQDVTLSYEINNKADGSLLCGGVVEEKTLKADETVTATFKTPVVAPKLWGPGKPNLYNISFTVAQDHDVLDQITDQVGFRTVEVRGDQFLLNGKPYWFRGANHMPGHMKPYDDKLAKKFMELALEHNVVATRTHCSPYSRQWMDAADETGVLISFEGPYPWLMLRDTPSDEAIEIWKREMGALVRENRNRPAVFLWTMNNEMKFYVIGGEDDVIAEKGQILTEGMQVVRQLDPTRPVVADSAYYRNSLVKNGRYERIILKYDLDEGDLDDPHGYFNWYNESVFHFMNGEFGKNYNTPGRALMGQEISTGYPRADDALPSRAYLFLHQTPQTTVGKDAYEESDPIYFIGRHSMLTKELVEMFRRVEHERSNGLMIFAFHTWFYHNHEVNQVSPMLTARRLKLAYEPILASAELWGRHFYAGDTLKSDITLVNEDETFSTLKSPKVICQLVSDGRVVASEELTYPSLDYYKTGKKTLALKIPEAIGAERLDGQLVLRVMVDGVQVSKNEYDVTVAQKKWAQAPDAATKGPYYMVGGDGTAKRLVKFYGLSAKTVSSVRSLTGKKGTLIVAEADEVSDYQKIAEFVEKGGNAILLNNRKAVVGLLPEWVKGYKPYRQEIVTMNRKESAVFDGLSPLDLAWFSDGRGVPYAATGRFSLDRFNNQVTALAETLQWHGYLKTPLDYREIGGVPLFKVKLGKGSVLVSELRIDAIDFDPIDARVIANILKYDFN
jgi:beta-galactosidase